MPVKGELGSGSGHGLSAMCHALRRRAFVLVTLRVRAGVCPSCLCPVCCVFFLQRSTALLTQVRQLVAVNAVTVWLGGLLTSRAPYTWTWVGHDEDSSGLNCVGNATDPPLVASRGCGPWAVGQVRVRVQLPLPSRFASAFKLWEGLLGS